ncbi:hypothetical protein K431DRAFT_229521 [Polychaeton citri CBS 116435]|uniref:CASTOR ACT domain-containing protein n=1 Tax=Polychaeton citri CBS 116435 TaxID=1314669 RepID=A0A9P4Q5V8_9PEZI|nr:hypothetical protein K431DRAFT_229521 [Polychaeton citri CBS 116435]
MAADSIESALAESVTLLNSTIGFLDTRLTLIHIPRESYTYFLQPISQLLLHQEQNAQDLDSIRSTKPWTFWHPFVNISLTSTECSIVCPRHEADRLFAPVLEGLSPHVRKGVSISSDDFSVITIGGEGLEAGQRVLDLSGPLAMAGISIFFITSYWSDFILVPFSARAKVIHALEERGFEFESPANGDGGHMTNIASPVQRPFHRSSSSVSSIESPPTPGTPPPKSVSELQSRTFKLLRRRNIAPQTSRDISLVTCAGMKDSTPNSSAANFTNGKLQLGLIKCLTACPPPRFLSVTLTDTESVSLTLERRLLDLFPNQGEDVLLGKDGDEQVAITFDLRELPLESTGIVCGVASKVIEGMKGRIGQEYFNMSYLSTVRAGHVIVYEDELNDVLEALEKSSCNGTA